MTMSSINPHISSNFDASLAELRDNVLMMASLTERNMENARRGFIERDEDWCNTAIADDEEIDTLEIQMDKDGIDVMLRFHPVASDMRNVLAAMKLSVSLERTSDQAVNIARRTKKLIGLKPLSEAELIDPMFDMSYSLYRDAIRAYADNDIILARSLKARDRKLDEVNRDVANTLTDAMTANPEQIKAYMELIFIARFLERIGDQATNIAEDTVFAVSAEDIRHTAKPAE
jgi:phosphate transport system protein